jgi:hypothetical protein
VKRGGGGSTNISPWCTDLDLFPIENPTRIDRGSIMDSIFILQAVPVARVQVARHLQVYTVKKATTDSVLYSGRRGL